MSLREKTQKGKEADTQMTWRRSAAGSRCTNPSEEIENGSKMKDIYYLFTSKVTHRYLEEMSPCVCDFSGLAQTEALFDDPSAQRSSIFQGTLMNKSKCA